MTVAVPRKGATRVADVPADVLIQLEAGTDQAVTLVENLATDFSNLLRAVLPDLVIFIDPKLGITKRMAFVADTIIAQYGPAKLTFLGAHRSDLMRGFGAYVVAALPEKTLAQKLSAMRIYADDGHFGVREWAWLALRPDIVKQPEHALELLQPWVREPPENLRRFAIEIMRPRGVWSAHIKLMKTNPEVAEALLTAVCADPARYVQDSVANWLNDAGKTQPDWVRGICAGWVLNSDSDATKYIVKRAQRNL